MIEFAILDLRKDRRKFRDLEEYLNFIAKRGWRVKCSIGNKLILIRKVKIE